MFELTRLFLLLFGILTIVGGAMGYAKAGSKASLVAGGVSGVLLLLAGGLMFSHPTVGVILGLIVSFLLAGRFIPAFLKKKTWMPAGMMAVLSAIGVVLTLLLFAGVR